MFEPFFDQYLPSVTFNGGKPVYVPLHPPAHSKENTTSDDWKIDFEELMCVIERSSMVVGVFTLSCADGPLPRERK